MSPLSNVCIVSYLFTFLIVSFNEQKALILVMAIAG